MNTREGSWGRYVFRPGQEGYECWLSRGCICCRRRGFVHTQQLRCHLYLIQQSPLQMLRWAIFLYKWTSVLLLNATTRSFFQYSVQARTYTELRVTAQSPFWSEKIPTSLKEMLYDVSKTDLSPDSSNKLSSWKKRKSSPSKNESELWKLSNLMVFNVSSQAPYHLEQ